MFLALGFTGPEHPLAEAFGVDMDRMGNYEALLGDLGGLLSSSCMVDATGCFQYCGHLLAKVALNLSHAGRQPGQSQ